MRKLFTLVAFLVTTAAAMAQTISESEAKEKAAQFFSQGTSGAKGKQTVQAPTLAYTSKDGDATCFYIYNNGNAGFVIIGGDEAAQEILGYSENGSFDYATAPENMKWWLSQYTAEISNAISNVKAGRAKIAKSKAKAGSITKTDVANLISAEWNQNAPYNNNIQKMPASWVSNKSDYQELATGCVATAAAQVMYKWKYPTKGTGNNSYTVYYKKNSEKAYCWDYIEDNTTSDYSMTFSADFNHDYQWGSMTDTYDNNSSKEAKDAVAQLMSDVGIASNMNYGQIANTGSGATSEGLGMALVNNFGYSKNTNMRYRLNYSDEEWENLVYQELATDRPVIYGATGTQDGIHSTGGHEFIICGYNASDNTYYINWGWGGQYKNDRYKLSGVNALTPSGEQGIGGAVDGSSFILDQGFLQNVKPEDGDAQRCYMYTCGFGLTDGKTGGKSLTVSAGTEVSMVGYSNVSNSGNIWNSGSSVITTEVGIRLKSSSAPIDISCGTGTFRPSTGGPLSFTPTEAGTYTVIPIYKSAGEWVEARTSTSIAYPTLTVTGTASGLSIVGEYGFENGVYTTKDNMKYNITLKNNGSACTKTICTYIGPADSQGHITSQGYLQAIAVR